MKKIIDGKKISEIKLNKIKKEIKRKKLNLKLVAILVGNNNVSEKYIDRKNKACEKVGIEFEKIKIKSSVKQKDLENRIEKIAKRKDVDGVMLQLPLPKKFKDQKIINKIPAEKDVDVLGEEMLGKFYTGNIKILPPTVSAIVEILKKEKINLRGEKVALIGAGRLVGYPLSNYLLRKKTSIISINEFTKTSEFLTKQADVVISGVGISKILKNSMVKKGAVIIDAGTSMHKGKLHGDADFDKIFKKAKSITPVPGGVGPITVACLLENLLILSK